ncbi:glycosyltransferase family 2 protein [Aliirhizobium smilacinae]|uniref:Glycosyltransferase family 2 protein n=1 Tax=Aliirhizobium smilacinae TaxID=1395944 RepID=A0A5C4XCP7_9HYPH|nr:glycosyltransferase [Rhizobium smilacinae]TNM61266.1 glycosyltransferase family 2 protein [Rhizobium smilacinae]
MQDESKASVEAVICIPTFRRPEGVARTLRSLLAQQTDLRFAIVVVENDAENPVGAGSAQEILGTVGIPHAVVIEPRQGNCHAINRAFTEARDRFPAADYFLMIDDDEIATPDWLSQMISTARSTGAKIGGGPVIRQFDVPVSKSVSQHPLYGFISGPTRQVPVIHGTGNCLIHRDVFARLEPTLFDVAFNFLGGGDMEFFARCHAAGFTFWWCEEAIIHETVAAERTTPNWLMRRSVRTGSINYVIDRKRMKAPAVAAKLQVKNVISLGLSLFKAIGLLARTKRFLPATHPILMSIGRITASFGFLPVPYKASEIPPAERQSTLKAGQHITES